MTSTVAPADLLAMAQRYHLSFTYMGHAAQEVRQFVSEGADFTCVTLEEYLLDPPGGGKCVAVTDAEKIITDHVNYYGALRQKSTELYEGGTPTLLISRQPKAAYPTRVGSNVIADARQIFLSVPDFEPADACGDAMAHARACLAEVGEDILMQLNSLVWEQQQDKNSVVSALPVPHQEALWAAGLLALTSGTLSWSRWLEWKVFKGALSESISSVSTPPIYLAQTFEDLWVVERELRISIRKALAEKSPSWKDSVVSGGLKTEVIDRAQRDGEPLARQINELRDPLEWLTTSELLNVREKHGLGDLGLNGALWAQMKRDLVPLRNRMAHMRLITDADATAAAQWRRIITQRLAV